MSEVRSHQGPPAAPLNRPLRLGVLISGVGTTLLNFVERIAAGDLRAEIPLVIASRSTCAGIERGRAAGLRVEVRTRKPASSAGETLSLSDYSSEVFGLLREANVDLVALAGFLSLLEIPDDFLGRVMNIHPSLIPAFCGRGFHGHAVHEAVLARGAKLSGCTVHFADNEYDHGPIILQRAVDVLDDDTPDTLAARVFEAECRAYPEAISLFAEGRLRIEGRRVRVIEACRH